MHIPRHISGICTRIFISVACVLAFQGSCCADTVMHAWGGKYGWQGWTSTGGWTLNEMPRTCNPAPTVSHPESGEAAQGTYRSPAFKIEGDIIEFWTNGWDGRDGGRGSSSFRLCIAKDGSILRQSAPPQQDEFVLRNWLVSDLRGQEVYFEAVDGIAQPAFAWLGLAQVLELRKSAVKGSSSYSAIQLDIPGTWQIMTRDGGSRTTIPYLSSLAEGEQGKGEISSPSFALTVPKITLKIRGWDGRFGERGSNIIQLIDSNTGEVLRKSSPPLSDSPATMSWDVADLKGRSVKIRLLDLDSNSSFAWWGLDEIDASPDYYVKFSNTASLSGWKPKNPRDPEYTDASGIPFAVSSSSAIPLDGSLQVPLNCRARHIFLLGMTNSLDQGCPVWTDPNDFSARFFIGDKIGEVRVVYTDNTIDHYPLVMGDNIWWGRRYDRFPEPFASDPKAAQTLKDSLRLFPAGSGRYLAVIAPGDVPIKSIEIADSPAKRGVPVILGLTIELAPGARVANGVDLPHDELSKDLAAFIQKNSLRKNGANEATAGARLSELRDILYTSSRSFPKHAPVTVPSGYNGPSFRFEGDAYAEVLTNILYANLYDMKNRVDAEGMYHTSAKDAPSWGGYEGFGTFNKRVGSYYTQSWTRDMGRTLGELCAFGFLDEASRCADYTLRSARVWEERPELRVDGQQLPRHICRVLQMPNTTPGEGCFENDGHGLTSLFIYNFWRHLPNRDEWLKQHWDDVQGLGDWIVWQFKHPELSGAKEVLRTDSECAGGVGYSIYADVACMEALLALSDMADSIGRTDKVVEWRTLAQRMHAGCESSYLIDQQHYGKTWTLAHSGWPNRSTVLGPIILPPDCTGFTSLGNDPWRAYDEAAYKRLVEFYKPFGFYGVAMGYGQGFVTQSALLLDKMQDATTMLQWAAKATYCAAYEPYIVPEGCEIDPTGKFWHRTGDLGNGVQQAEIVKALRIVIGVDDTDPKQLHLCPRMPYGWTSIYVGKLPVLVERDGHRETAHVSYSLKRTNAGMDLTLTSDKPLTSIGVRLGAFKNAPKSLRVNMNGNRVKAKSVQIGDAYWVSFGVPEGLTRVVATVNSSLPN